MSSFSSVTKAFKSNDTKKEVTIEEAEKAVETLLTWIGDDPKREGLVETPKRVIKAFSEHFTDNPWVGAVKRDLPDQTGLRNTNHISECTQVETESGCNPC